MPFLIRNVWIPLLFGVLAGTLSPACADSGQIRCRVSLEDNQGQVVYGDWVRVFLVTAAVEIPRLDLTGASTVVERKARINSAHMTFFMRFREMMGRDGYLMDDKLTRPDGTVAFHRVPPGRYYLIVTFPTMIAGQKAAWQQPVNVVAGRAVHADLNTANRALEGL
jgi:hypothetical protein